MRTSTSQFTYMVEFMEKHGDLSKTTEGVHGRLKNICLWTELGRHLNSDPTGDKKTCFKWRKVWSDLKNNTKKKAARLQRAAGSGDSHKQSARLTPLDKRVLQIIEQYSTAIPETPCVLIKEYSLSERGVPAEVEQVTSDGDSVPKWSPAGVTPATVWVELPDVEQPSSAPPSPALSAPPSPAPSAPPSAPRCRRRWRPLPAAARPLARRADAEWRSFKRERARQQLELERERLRLREAELQQQARWQELCAQLLSIVGKVADKYLGT